MTRRGMPARVLRRVLLGVGLSAVVPAGAAVVGTLAWRVPYLGSATAVVVPWIGVFVALPLLGAAAGLVAWQLRRTGPALALVVAGLVVSVTAAGVAVVVGAALVGHGATVDLAGLLTVRTPAPAAPDDDVEYTRDAEGPLRMAVYRPPVPLGGTRVAPVVLYLHGGGWVQGDRLADGATLRWIADHGWLVFSADYRLSGPDRHRWDVVPAQVGCALARTSGLAARYGGDPARVSLLGVSAGGNLAVNAAEQAAQGRLTSSCGDVVPTVAAVSVLAPVVDPAALHDNPDPVRGAEAASMTQQYTGGSPRDVPDRYRVITATSYLSAHTPPLLLMVGEADHLVPPDAAYAFADAARSAGARVELVRVPFGDHNLAARPGSLGLQAFRSLTLAWLTRYGSGSAAGG